MEALNEQPEPQVGASVLPASTLGHARHTGVLEQAGRGHLQPPLTPSLAPCAEAGYQDVQSKQNFIKTSNNFISSGALRSTRHYKMLPEKMERDNLKSSTKLKTKNTP